MRSVTVASPMVRANMLSGAADNPSCYSVIRDCKHAIGTPRRQPIFRVMPTLPLPPVLRLISWTGGTLCGVPGALSLNFGPPAGRVFRLCHDGELAALSEFGRIIGDFWLISVWGAARWCSRQSSNFFTRLQGA